jgi:hypothetical protein
MNGLMHCSKSGAIDHLVGAERARQTLWVKPSAVAVGAFSNRYLSPNFDGSA